MQPHKQWELDRVTLIYHPRLPQNLLQLFMAQVLSRIQHFQFPDKLPCPILWVMLPIDNIAASQYHSQLIFVPDVKLSNKKETVLEFSCFISLSSSRNNTVYRCTSLLLEWESHVADLALYIDYRNAIMGYHHWKFKEIYISSEPNFNTNQLLVLSLIRKNN